MARPPSDIQTRILDAVEKQLRQVGVAAITIETIAAATGCAKGLVNYHFKTKNDVFAAVAERLFREREGRWKDALATATPEAAISQSWEVLAAEASTGFWKAWGGLASMTDKVTVRTVNNFTESFCQTIGASVRELLGRMGLTPTVAPEELGHMVAASVQGFGMQLSNGISLQHVESAHAALWLAILSLTRRIRRP